MVAACVLAVVTLVFVAALHRNLEATVGGAAAGPGLCDAWYAARRRVSAP